MNERHPWKIAAGCILTTACLAHGMPPNTPNASELALQIEGLGVVANVLYVAAHPDDENTRLLSYFVSERHARAAYLSITRGEGGQNLIGSEQGPALGLIRTQELLAARRIDGAEQFFTRARDFGYSKSAKETLAIWDKNAVLSDVVWVIRKFRPDVIITRFSPEDGETHGHHTASAELALEAFKAAADATAFPEQLKDVPPWQAKRIVWNRFFFGAKPQVDLSGYIKLDTGGFNALLGKSYGEIAAASRSMHKSQGFGASASRGPSIEYFHHLAGEKAERDLFDGVETTWKRMNADYLTDAARRARDQFRFENPASAIPGLLDINKLLSSLPSSPTKEYKSQQLAKLVAGCAGMWLEATSSEPTVSPGSQVNVTAVAINRSSYPILLENIELTGASTLSLDTTLGLNEPLQQQVKITVPTDAPLSQPYWLREAPAPGIFRVADQQLIGLPEAPQPLETRFVLKLANQRFALSRPLEYKWTDPVAGESYRPVEIVPPVAINPALNVLFFPTPEAKSFRVSVQATSGAVFGTVTATAGNGWTVEPASIAFKFDKKGDEREYAFRVRPPGPLRVAKSPAESELSFVAESANATSSRGIQRIEHPHIPMQLILPEARVRLVRGDVRIGKPRIAYIPGPGDTVPLALQQLGYSVNILSNEALRTENLSRYDAIVTGVRAFNTNSYLIAAHSKLMQYVFNGGTMLVQYNTNNRLSRVSTEIGPYPFEISQDRFTDETATVEIEQPSSSLFHKPNEISKADFDDWIQERGLYFAGRWDGKYKTVISLHDPGESPKRGAVLVTRYGKGGFIYTGLAFFRQLPAGVVGAHRLFANMLAYGNPG